MNKKYLLKTTVQIAALLGAIYLPTSAMANETVAIGDIKKSAAPGADFYDDNVMKGAFTDTYTFDVTKRATLSGTMTANYQTVGAQTSFASGVELTSVELVNITTGAITMATESVRGPVTAGPFKQYADTFTFASTTLYTDDKYKLVVTGIGGSSLTTTATAGHYIGAVGVSLVPEPEQWAMLLLGLPLMGWVAKRKQANSSNLLAA